MLTQKVTELIGKTSDTVIMEVEKGAIRKFADAVGETNPLYWDEEYARGTRFGEITAHPGFFGWPTMWKKAMPFFSALRSHVIDTISEAGYARIVDGGIEYDFYLPVRAGDTLSAVSRIKDIYERETRTGKMLFSITEWTYTNQNGEIVATARQTVVHR